MEIVTKVMEKSWKFVGKNVYEPCGEEGVIVWRSAWRFQYEQFCSLRVSFNSLFLTQLHALEPEELMVKQPSQSCQK